MFLTLLIKFTFSVTEYCNCNWTLLCQVSLGQCVIVLNLNINSIWHRAACSWIVQSEIWQIWSYLTWFCVLLFYHGTRLRSFAFYKCAAVGATTYRYFNCTETWKSSISLPHLYSCSEIRSTSWRPWLHWTLWSSGTLAGSCACGSLVGLVEIVLHPFIWMSLRIDCHLSLSLSLSLFLSFFLSFFLICFAVSFPSGLIFHQPQDSRACSSDWLKTNLVLIR